MQAAKTEAQAEMQALQEKLQAEIANLKRSNSQLKNQLKDATQPVERASLHVVQPAQPTPLRKKDARAILYAALESNPNLKLAELAQLASANGFELSESACSRHRSAFVASKNASSTASSELAVELAN